MKDNDVIRMFGKADSFDIEFTKTAESLWQCNVPPDLTDGQYATEIYAVTESGEFAYWTGILYMSRGKPSLVLKRCRYFIKCLPSEKQLNFMGHKTYLKGR